MAEKYESFKKYLIEHIFEQLPDITQPVYTEVSKVFYEENVGGVLYQFEFDFPSIDDMPLKKGLSGTDIPDFNKIAKDTSVKVQRVFPDGEVIVDFEFNVAGRGGDLEAYETFSKSLAEGKGMKGVVLDYYDEFPVETTLTTTLENDITIPNTPEVTDTPTNVVDDNYIKGPSNGPSRTDKILIETLEDFASYSKIPFSEPIEILKQNQGLKMNKELGYTEDGLLYLYNSIDNTYEYVDPNNVKKLTLFLQENDLIDFLYTNQLYVPFQINADKEILTKEEILKLPDIPVNHITEGQGIIRNLKKKYPDELIDLDVDFDNVDGGRINIQSLFIDSDLKEKEIYEDIANELNQLSNKYNISINNYDDNPIHNFYNIIDTPTNVVDNIPVGGVREEPFFKFGENIDIPLQINEQGNVIFYRTTNSPDYLQVSDFAQKNKSDIGTLGFGEHTYFGPNIETPQAFWVASSDRGLYKYDTNIKPSEIFIGSIGDKPELAKALGIPEQYWNMNYHRFLLETKDTYRKVLTNNIETFKKYGIKALGRYGGTSGEKSFEIIPLITNEDNLGIKAVAELEPIKGIGKGGADNWKVKETSLDTPTNVVGAEVIDEGVDITESSAGVVDEIEGVQKETLEKLTNANDAFVNQQLDDIMARKINEVLPFVDTTINRADSIGIAITGSQVLDSADPVLNSFIKEIEQLTGENLQTSEKRKLRQFIYDMATGKDNLLDDKKSFISNLRNGVDNSKLKDPGYKIWKNWQNSGSLIPKNLLGMSVNEFSAFGPPGYVRLLEGLEKSGENINYKAISDAGLDIPDTPTNVVGNEFVDNYGKTTTGFIDDLPLEKPVKDVFLNAADSRLKRLGTQIATPGGILDTVDIWEIGVLALVAGAIAYNEIDEIPKITKNTILRTYNLSQGRPIDAPLRIIGLPVLSVSEYDIDFEYAMETLEKGEKVMPTEIAIDYVQEKAKEFEGEGTASGYAYMTPSAKNTDTMETTQKIQPGVQEEKMFEQLRPKKTKSAGGSGARIQ